MSWMLLSLLVVFGWTIIGCAIALLVGAASHVGSDLENQTNAWTQPGAAVLPLRPRT